MNRSKVSPHRLWPRIAGCTLLLSACLVHKPLVEVVTPYPGYHVTVPVKAHLVDGATVVYPMGVTVRADTLYGAGREFDLHLKEIGPVAVLPMGRVLAMEQFTSFVDALPSVTLSIIAAPVIALLAAGGAVAIFGSCPTVYADSAGVAILQGESFSYSIAPLLEARDVDRLRVWPDQAGVVRVEIRNEALETHYINHLELLEVVHEPGTEVVPDPAGFPLVVAASRTPLGAHDRAGRDVAATLRTAEEVAYRSQDAVLAKASAVDLLDQIWLDFPVASGVDTVALVFRMRNSLLTTVLFYDVMLAGQGPRSLEWLGRDLDRIGPATDLGLWAVDHLGMRVEVGSGDDYRPVARIPDAGPIAWKDVVVLVPVLEQGRGRVRLSFPIDGWRIDQITVTDKWHRAAPRVVPLSRIVLGNGEPDSAALAAARALDQAYAVTMPGTQLVAEFETGQQAQGGSRSFLLAAQGYYTEWVRASWLANAPKVLEFTNGSDLMGRTFDRWRASRQEMEASFHASRLPVR